MKNEEDTKEKASTSPHQLEPSVEAEVIEINDEETKKKTKKNNKKVSSRKQCSLPQTIASRLQQNSPSEAVPSPSTHTLFASESPMNSVEDTNVIITSKTNPIDTPKAQATSLNRIRNSSTNNTPAVSNLVLEQTQDIAQMNENEEEKDLSEEIRLEFNEDDDEDNENQINEQQEEQKSILTDDDDDDGEESNKENNMTRDVLNTTVDKSFGALPCTSFYKSTTSSANNNQIDANLVEPSTSREANNVAVTQEVATVDPMPVIEPYVKPKSIGHARIVRPTQKVETIETVLVPARSKVGPIEEAVVVKKTVEVVRREAGPRIVKPCAATVSGADDETTATDVTAKKLPSKVKSTSKMPDFKAIHEKNANKLESIKDFAERKAMQKINKQTKSPHMPKQMSLAAMPTKSKAASITDSVDNNQKSLAKTPMSKFTSRVRNYLSSGSSTSSASGCVTNGVKENQAKEGTTPKVVKTGAVHAMQNMASSVISTFIPRFKHVNIEFII